jgi:hypothetical protein
MRVVAVVKPAAHALSRSLAAEGCEVVVCDNAAEGMGASLACAARAAGPTDGYLVALGDMPFVRPSSIAAVRDALAAEGLEVAQPAIDRVLRFDLEGDGVDEVLIQANRRLDDDAAPGSYSVVLLRRVDEKDVARDIVLHASVGQWLPTPASPDDVPTIVEVSEIAGLVDGNGDGVFDLVTETDYYEGGWQSLYDLRGEPTSTSTGCGA